MSNRKKTLVLLLLVIFLIPMSGSMGEAVNLDPGYIAGEVSFPGFSTKSISMTAVGGGYSSQKSTFGSSNYQMTVEGGDWDYSVSTSCGLNGGNNSSVSVYFNKRSFPVAPGETVTNDYVYNSGTIRFQVNITGDPTTSSRASSSRAKKITAPEEKTDTYSSGTSYTAARSYSWEIPVVPNQQIELSANIYVQGLTGGRFYSFSKTAGSPYTVAPRDVAPGEMVVVPLNIHFEAPAPYDEEDDDYEPPPPPVFNTGFIEADVNLLGLPSFNFVRHTVSNGNITTNPGAHLYQLSFVGSEYLASVGSPYTFFDESVDSSLKWPLQDSSNLLSSNRVTVYPDMTSNINFEREGGFLTGKINLSGPVKNEDLKSITFRLSGVGRLYDPVTRTYSYRENYDGSAILRRDATAYNAKRTSERDYKLFLTTGDWEISNATFSKQHSSPTRTSGLTFVDYNMRYDGQTYFGTPIHIDPGTNVKDIDYCFGSAILRFRDRSGGLLSDPYVRGKGIHKTNGVVDLDITTTYSNSYAKLVENPELELFGPPADYTLTTIQVKTEDGTTITFPDMNLNLACNTIKKFDIPGPTLNMTSPQGETITNAQSLPVSGRALSDLPVESVTVNGLTATLNPVIGGSPNEVGFNLDLPLIEGDNTITATATDVSGAQATDQLIVFVDRWLPTVSILTPEIQDRFLSTDDSISLHVQAADRGYGYALEVYLDGTLIHSANGAADALAPVSLSYEGVIGSLSGGEHHITATVTDKAGNSATTGTTFVIYWAQDSNPPALNGLNDQVAEAVSVSGTAVSFDVTAASTCSTDPTPPVLPSPVLTPQRNSISTLLSISKAFEWSAIRGIDSDPVQYQVQVSKKLDFTTVDYSSPWQSETFWTHTLPRGTWYWRVTARDSVHTDVRSIPAAGNGFSILFDGTLATVKHGIMHYSVRTGGGYVYQDIYVWAGPWEGDVDRSFLMFDSSAIGAGATVTSAKLYMDYRNSDYLYKDSVTNVYESTWIFPGDQTTFNNLGALLDSQLISVSRPFGLVPFNIRPDYINKTGITKFALAAANENLNQDDSDPGYARATSYLEVTYVLPGLANWPAPVLTPQENASTNVENVNRTFEWGEMTAADGDAVQYLVEISKASDFSTVYFSSSWQTGTTWTHSLPAGTWYWRVTARDAVHNSLISDTAASGFVISTASAAEEVAVTCTPQSGSVFSLGSTTVTCTARDACDRVAVGDFSIAVQDTVPPVLVVPDGVIVEATAPLSIIDIGQATATDIFPVTIANDAPAEYYVGTTPVAWTATDANGNEVSGVQSVTVMDTTAPLVVPPADLTVELTGDGAQIDIGDATATDALGVISITSDAPAVFPVGFTLVTWTATDAAGNIGTAVQTITITENTPPSLEGLVDQILEATSPSGVIAEFNVTATDLVDPAPVLTCSEVSGSTFPLGETTVTCTATDATGNSATGSFTVTVRDTTPPELTVPEEITVLLNTSASSQAVQDLLNGATAVDLVDPEVTITATTPENLNIVGINEVAFTAVDDFGNQTTGSTKIRVVYGCGGFLPPVVLEKPFKRGSTIPVKLELCDAYGNPVTSAVVKLLLEPGSSDGPIEPRSTNNADDGNLFRVTGKKYMYNLYTKNLSPDTYQLRAVLDDGTMRTVPLTLK
jgi:hypothetical protein